jgi:hypothetical protein
MVVAAAYGGRRPRQQPTRLPVMRLDVVVVLLLVFFFIGLYVPGLVSGGSGSGEPRSRSLFHSGGGGRGGGCVSPEDLEQLRGQMAALVERLEAAEGETRAVMEENARLRLDNKVEQSNLKSLTKAKNDEIKRLNAEVEELKKKGGGGEEADAACKKAQQEAAALQKELGEAQRELKRLRAKGGGAAVAVKGAEDAAERPGAPPPPPPQEQQKAEAGDDDDDGKSSSLSRRLISVPEPQPLNTYWEPRIKKLFDLVRAVCMPCRACSPTR